MDESLHEVVTFPIERLPRKQRLNFVITHPVSDESLLKHLLTAAMR